MRTSTAPERERFDVVSPVTGILVGSVPIPSPADLDAAVRAANDAQPAWAAVNVWKRAEICHRIGDELISKRVGELARLQTLEQGKPLAESIADIEEAAQLFHLHAEDAVRLHGEVLPSSDSRKRMFTFHRPVGTWGIITPWNFPLLMLAEFVAPGLATGNAHVVKPPANTPLTVLKAMEAFDAAGVPRGLVNIVPGEGATGDALVLRHPRHRRDRLHRILGDRREDPGRRGLEALDNGVLGNGPLVVLADADLDAAATAAVYGASLCSGQVCCATERVVVHRDVHDDFVEAVLRAAKSVVLGDPFDGSTNLGPLNNEGVAAKMDRHMADARERGAEILTGGNRRAGQPTDLYYEFSVVDGVAEDSMLSREESFGPVVPIIVGASNDELLRIANNDKLGLQGAVFTRDMAAAFHFIENMAVGQVVVNDSTCFWDINMPFGGAGGRGTGWGRIGGKWTLLGMTDVRTGVINL